MLKLNRIQCLLFGLLIIFIFYFLNRSQYIFSSEKVTGTFVYYVEVNDTSEGKLFYPVIEYKYQDHVYHLNGREGTAYKLNQSVPVLLEHKDPAQPLLYTLESFWLYPLFYILLPVLLWAAFSLSYIAKDEIVQINLKYPFFRKEKPHPSSLSKGEGRD
jgi:hypothetical protein